MVATLGPEAWPRRPRSRSSPRLIDQPRHLHPLLRHQGDIAGIGRSWVDEILWEAASRPSRRARSSTRRRSSACTPRCTCSATRSTTTRRRSASEVPDKVPMPLQVHKREGEPCPRCGTTIEAVFFSEHQTNYCPQEQTGGAPASLKDAPPLETAEVAKRARAGG